MHLLLVDVRFCNPLVEQIPLKMYIVPFWIFTFFFSPETASCRKFRLNHE